VLDPQSAFSAVYFSACIGFERENKLNYLQLHGRSAMTLDTKRSSNLAIKEKQKNTLNVVKKKNTLKYGSIR